MSEFTPLTKEILKGYINEHEHYVLQRQQLIKRIIREKYNEIIKLATKGDTKYVFPLTDYLKCLNNRVNFNNLLANTSEYGMKFINELISSIYLVLPDSNIQYNEKKIYDLQDRETIIPCIIIDWS